MLNNWTFRRKADLNRALDRDRLDKELFRDILDLKEDSDFKRRSCIFLPDKVENAGTIHDIRKDNEDSISKSKVNSHSESAVHQIETVDVKSSESNPEYAFDDFEEDAEQNLSSENNLSADPPSENAQNVGSNLDPEYGYDDFDD